MSLTAIRADDLEAERDGAPVFRSRLRTPPTNDLVARVARDESAGRYDHAAAALLAIACAWSYGDGQSLADVLHRCGFKGSCRLVHATAGALFVDTDAFVLADEGFVAVVFRGTEIGDAKYIDVLSDFYSSQDPFFATAGAGSVHVGFQQAYLPVHDPLVDALRDELSGDRTLYVSGHSLGGALAVLATAALLSPDAGLESARKRFRGLYTYGQPMVGDEAFAEFCAADFGDQTFRHVFHHDLVPRLPPRWTSGEFAHFGHEYRGAEKLAWTLQKDTIRAVRTVLVPLVIAAGGFVAQQIVGLRWLPPYLPYSLDDHRPQAYVDCSKLTAGSFAFP